MSKMTAYVLTFFSLISDSLGSVIITRLFDTFYPRKKNILGFTEAGWLVWCRNQGTILAKIEAKPVPSNALT